MDSIQFLDTEVSHIDGKFYTKLYVKPTDRNTLVRFNSAHPRRMIKALLYSQLMHVKKIVNIESELDPALNAMVTSLLIGDRLVCSWMNN